MKVIKLLLNWSCPVLTGRKSFMNWRNLVQKMLIVQTV